MKKLLFKISHWVKTNQDDIILLIGVILISLLSFAMGYIVAKQQEKEPLKIGIVRTIERSMVLFLLATNFLLK